jgi:serine/threonine protein kinase
MNHELPTDDHDPPNALPRGTLLNDKFRVQRVIGVGGFGIVYLAHDEMSDVDVAIKEYMPASLAGRTKTMQVSLTSQSNAETFALGLKSFWNEARLLAKFRDEHLPLLKVYDAFQANGTAYMVMPVLRGRTAYQLRRDMPAPPTERWLRALLTDLLPALERLHAENVFHRDISPDNIQVDTQGKPVLMDLGAARHVISNRTQSITAILKPGYAPIEQYGESEKLRQGPWTDIYALGATLHFLLLNKSPAAATARIFDPGTPLVAHDLPGCAPAFLRVIDWMLEPRPEARPQNVEQLRTALFDSDDATVVMAPRKLPPAPVRPAEIKPVSPPKSPPAEPVQATLAPTLAVARPQAATAPAPADVPLATVRATAPVPSPAAQSPSRRSPVPMVMAGAAVLVVAGAAAMLWPRSPSKNTVAGPPAASQPEVTPAAFPRSEPPAATTVATPAAAAPALAPTPAAEPPPVPPPAFTPPAAAAAVSPAAIEATSAQPSSAASSSPKRPAATTAATNLPATTPPAATPVKKTTAVNDKDGALLPRPAEPAPTPVAASTPAPALGQSPTPAPSPPAPAATPGGSAVASPTERCSDKSGIARRLCVAVVCGLPELHSHPECAAIRRN